MEDKTSAQVPEGVQEKDAWWGSYSAWTMMPSMVVCLVLTAIIAWGSLLDRGWGRLSVLTLAACRFNIDKVMLSKCLKE